MVLMADRNTPLGHWPKALVEQTFPDSEEIVCQVIVRTAEGVYRKDIRKLLLLEKKLLSRIEEQDNSANSNCVKFRKTSLSFFGRERVGFVAFTYSV